jgi:methylenetetrahydrofolate dehydrogenase (NADP+)/methenyltetrahydrofolate cyclohydrolase
VAIGTAAGGMGIGAAAAGAKVSNYLSNLLALREAKARGVPIRVGANVGSLSKEMLRRYGIALEGANAVVLGRSDIVGKPMALLLMHANATVTICHSKTRNLPEVVRRADIVVAAMGKAGFVQADWIRPGAAVVDVGTNKVTDVAEAERLLKNFPQRLEKFRAKGNVLIGDVHPDALFTAGALSPVPGGVGPMTITMLMSNTVKAARLRRGASSAVAR